MQLVARPLGDADQPIGECADPLQPGPELGEGREPVRPVQRQQVVDDDSTTADAALTAGCRFSASRPSIWWAIKVHAQQDIAGANIHKVLARPRSSRPISLAAQPLGVAQGPAAIVIDRLDPEAGRRLSRHFDHDVLGDALDAGSGIAQNQFGYVDHQLADALAAGLVFRGAAYDRVPVGRARLSPASRSRRGRRPAGQRCDRRDCPDCVSIASMIAAGIAARSSSIRSAMPSSGPCRDPSDRRMMPSRPPRLRSGMDIFSPWPRCRRSVAAIRKRRSIRGTGITRRSRLAAGRFRIPAPPGFARYGCHAAMTAPGHLAEQCPASRAGRRYGRPQGIDDAVEAGAVAGEPFRRPDGRPATA